MNEEIKNEIKKVNQKLENAPADQILAWAIDRFGAGNISLASSFGAEDQVLTHIVQENFKEINIFTLDTGRLPQETYDVMDKTMKRYDFKYHALFPKLEDIENLLSEQGPNSFYESVENRKHCCYIRKVKPLKRKLETLQAWITGLRRSQTVTRESVKAVEWDESFQLVKLNPLVQWSEKDVWDFIKSNNVPYNALHDQGYPSIGCAPCTRPVSPGEDIRAGRWWWESPEHKECGLHRKKNEGTGENK